MDTRRRIDRLCRKVPDASFAVRYWDGAHVGYGDGPAEFTISLKSEAVAAGLFGNIALRLPEAYAAGDIEIDGDLQRFTRVAYLADTALPQVGATEKALLAAMALKQRNSLAGSRRNIAHQYDLGNDFFKLWLDRQMVYSCAYFRGTEDDINTAQEQKLEYICAKLRLSPNDRLLDMGCGWGALAIHAARTCCARVVGVTLSEQQQREASARVCNFGLGDRVEIRFQDYRDVPEHGSYDRIVSVGMFEHVGKKHLGSYMKQTARLLKPGGAGVLQTIGRMREGVLSPWIRKHLFPGLYLPALSEVIDVMAANGLVVTDVENLRMHYALTLDRWAAAFERNRDRVRTMFDESFFRMWRMYLHSTAGAFRYGDLNLWQVTFTCGLINDLPLTREHLYSRDSKI